jgi:virginiamycin B lyase
MDVRSDYKRQRLGYFSRIDLASHNSIVIQPPTADQGSRRIWSDSHGRLWITEWNAGKLAVYDPAATNKWKEWKVAGNNPMPYAVYVDRKNDMVWLSDFGANAIMRFDPTKEKFNVFVIPTLGANVRQILGRPGEIWGAESGTDKLVVLKTAL